MRKFLLLIVFAACAARPDAVIVVPTVAYPFDRDALLRDDVRACADEIERLSGAHFERAAFLRLRDDGAFDCRLWPGALHADRAEWAGAPVDGTVAIIHSHPRDFPEPSQHDRQEAVRIGVPVLVVTPGAISMASPRKNESGFRVAYTARDETARDHHPHSR